MEDKLMIESKVENLELYSDNYPFNLSLRISAFENEVDYKKFVLNCEALIRRSREFKLWKQYLVDVLGVQECFITHEVMEDVSIEIHHHVPSLYILVSALVNKHITEETPFCSFDISTEAIELHYANRIGYVALLRSIHEKFHNGKLEIPISLVRGNYQYFMENFTRFVDPGDLDLLQERLVIHEIQQEWTKDNYPGLMRAAG
jgi:hypothetical protein